MAERTPAREDPIPGERGHVKSKGWVWLQSFHNCKFPRGKAAFLNFSQVRGAGSLDLRDPAARGRPSTRQRGSGRAVGAGRCPGRRWEKK